MAAGLLVINTHGTVLIDDTYSNLAVRNRGTLPAQSGYRNVSLTNPAQPIIAVGSTNYAIAAWIYGNQSAIWSEGGADVDWYSFDTPTSSGSFGLQVFTSSGQLTFDSSRQYARVVDVFSGVTTKNYPAGRTYAVAALTQARGIEWVTRPVPLSDYVYADIHTKTIAPRVRGGTITTSWQTILIAPGLTPIDPALVPPNSLDPNNSATFAVLDVTGY